MLKKIRKKLSSQLSFYILISLLSVFLIIAISTYIHMDSIIEERIYKETYLKNKATSQEIRSVFEKAEIITKQMSFNNEIKTYLSEVKTQNDILNHPLYPSVLKTLEDIHESNPLNYVVWIANENASFFIDSEGFISDENYEVKNRSWYKEAVESSDVFFSHVYTDWKTQTHVISSILSLRRPSGIYGFIAVDTSFSFIPSIYKDIDIGKNSKFFLLAEDGRYIYKNNLDLNPNEEEENILPSIYDPNDLLYPYADIIFKEKNAFKEIKINNEDWYISYYLSTENNWISIYLINKSEAKKDSLEFALILFFIFVISILILLLIIRYSISEVTSPIQAITQYSKDISSGNFTNTLPKKYTLREDEIGDLSRSFNIITEVFREENMLLEDRIKEKNEEIQKQYQYIIENEKLASLATLIAGVAHEINTPIGVAITSSSFIKNLCKEINMKFDNNTIKKIDLIDFLDNLDESNKLLLNNICRSADLIRSFKQIAVDQSSESLSIFNINFHVDSIITSLRHEYKKKNILIRNYCPKTLTINSYPGSFSQIITNLIMNSIHHAYDSNKGGIIIITAEEINDKIEIHYTDDGRGIDEKDMPNIFDPFFTTNRKSGNSGLGLHIVYNIVTQLLDGSITCEDNNGLGVHFTISLPLTLKNAK